MKFLRPVLATALAACAAISHGAAVEGPARLALSGGDQRFIEMPANSAGARFFVNGGAQSIAFDANGARLTLRGSLAKSTAAAGLRFDFAAANPVVPQGADESGARYHWLVGPRDAWATDLRAFGSISYRGVWSGVDATWNGDRSGIKYHFTVAPGANPKAIAFTVSGAQDARIAADGALEWKLGDAWQRDERPAAWQSKSGRNVDVKAAYRLEKLDASSWRLAFDLGDYDQGSELVLDPAWSSFSGLVGGNASDQVFALKRDAAGNTFACGATASNNLPVTAGYTAFPGDSDNAFIVKFNSAGAPQFVTYLGGNGFDSCNGLALDGAGNIYVTGATTSTNLSLTGSADALFKRAKAASDRDAFVFKFQSDGKSVVYSGVIGGTLDDQANAIAVDASGRAYVTGYTTCTATTAPGCSAGFPTKTGPSTSHGGDASGTFGQDAFVLRILGDGSTLDYSGFIGGNGAVEAGRGIAVTVLGEAIVAGETDSTAGLPASAGFRTAAGNGDGDGFVAKVNAGGSGFSFFNVLAGVAGTNSGIDRALAVAIDPADGAIVVVGETDSDSFPANAANARLGTGAQNTLAGNMDGFVLRISSDGNSVLTASYIGGSGFDTAEGVAADGAGGIYVAGSTSAGSGFPVVATAGLSTTRFGAQDGFIAKILQSAPAAFNYSGFVGANATNAATTTNDAMHAIDVSLGILSVGGATGANPASITGATGGALGAANASPNGVVLRINNLANTFTIVSGTPQSKPVSTAFAPLIVKVQDSDGNPLANYPVTFAAPGSGASATLNPASFPIFTNAAGVAQVAATANASVGAYNVTASLPNFTTLSFALTNQFVASITVTAPQSAISQNTSITFTATVTGSSPTGTVDFLDGATTVCAAVALSSSVATCTTSTLAPGTHSITAVYSGNTLNTPATTATPFSLLVRAAQVINFTQPADKVFGDAAFDLVATGGGSGNAVTFTTTTTTVCTLAGTNNKTVTIVGAGTCSVTANQAGNTNFDAAPPVTKSFLVAMAAQVINFTQPSDKVFGDAAFDLVATGGGSVSPVTFSTLTTTVCTLGGTNNRTVTIVGAGTCTATANQAGTANYNAAAPVSRTFNVAKAAQVISFVPPAAKNFGDAPFTLTATGGTSGNPVTFSSTTSTVCMLSGINNATVTIVGPGNCVVTASQLGNANYADATPVPGTTVVSAVAPGAPTIGAATPGPASATIAFTAPTFTGGSPITGYTVSCTPGPVTQGGTVSPITLNGLSNTLYTCSVRATNAVGPGAASGTVTVTPSPSTFTLSVATNGTGTGSVASNPPGVNCPGTCSAPFANGAVVTLTPTPTAGSLFTSWAGACTGSGACQVTMDAAKSVTATFTLNTSPNQFTFVDQANLQPNTVVTSNTVTMAGLGAAGAISVTGGSYSIGCTATFTTAAGTINNGQTVCVRHTTPLALSTATNTTLTVGATSDTFTSTTSATLDPALDADDDGIPNGVEPAEGRNPLVKDNDIFGVNRLFVMQQYRDFLGHEGDAGGITYSTNLLATGAAVRGNIAESFFRSGEYQNYAGPLVRLYFGALLRAPDLGGYQFQLARLRSGVVIDDIADGFGASPEFTARYGALTNSQFVAQVYLNVLGRAGSQGEIDYHVARLAAGLSRGRFMLGFTESPEYVTATRSETFVTMLYTAMLRRIPEPAAYTYWNAQLDGGLPVLTMVIGIFNSGEYHNRFLP